jgi:hypothetical protein
LPKINISIHKCDFAVFEWVILGRTALIFLEWLAITLDFEISVIVVRTYSSQNEILHKSPLALADLVTSDRATLRCLFILRLALPVCRPVDSLRRMEIPILSGST